MRCDVKNLNLIIKYCDDMASDIHACCFMDAITRTFRVSEAGPPGSDLQCDSLDDSFLGSNEDLKNYAIKFEAMNREVEA